MRVRFAKLKPKIHKPPFELVGKPRTCGKAANEKCELFMVTQEWYPYISEHTNRVDGNASPEVISDRVHSRLNRRFEEPRNLRAVNEKGWMPIHNSVTVSLPGQGQPPGLDPVARIIISRRAKLDILIRKIIRHRKDLL
jgi:hypothetical protein